MASTNNRVLVYAAAGAAAVGLLGLAWYLSRPSDEEASEGKRRRPAAHADAPAAAPGAAAATDAPAGAAAATASAATGGSPAGGTLESPAVGVSKGTLRRVLVEMIERLKHLKEELEGRFASHFEESRGDLQLAQTLAAQELQEGVQRIEKEVQGRHKVTQAQLMHAQAAHAGDEEIKELMTDLKRIFFGDDGGGEQDLDAIEVPEGMTADLFATKFDAHVDAVDAAFVRAIEAARAAAPRGERMQYMHLTMMRQLESVNAEAVARAGLTEDEFQRCLMKFQHDPRIVEKIVSSQTRQEELRRHLIEED